MNLQAVNGPRIVEITLDSPRLFSDSQAECRGFDSHRPLQILLHRRNCNLPLRLLGTSEANFLRHLDYKPCQDARQPSIWHDHHGAQWTEGEIRVVEMAHGTVPLRGFKGGTYLLDHV